MMDVKEFLDFSDDLLKRADELLERVSQADNHSFLFSHDSAQVDARYSDLLFAFGLVRSIPNDDFPFIARDFYGHFSKPELSRMYRNQERALFLTSGMFALPSMMSRHELVDLLLNFAREGEVFALQMLRVLYRTYLKQQYNCLKRFSKITSEEVLSLALDNKAYSGPDDHVSVCINELAGYAVMIPFLGIQIPPDELAALHKNVENSFQDKLASIFCVEEPKISDDLWDECVGVVLDWTDETIYDEEDVDHANELLHTEERPGLFTSPLWQKAYDFMGLVFNEQMMNKDCTRLSYLRYNGLRVRQFATALAYRVMSDEDFDLFSATIDDVLPYVLVMEMAYCFSSESHRIACTEHVVNGMDFDQFEPVRYRSEKVVSTVEQAAKPTPVVLASPVILPAQSTEADKVAVLEAEIRSLRGKITEKESDYRSLRKELEEARKTHAEDAARIELFQSEREELTALRKFMSELNDEDNLTTATSVSVDDMVTALAGRKLVVVGGNQNWIKKFSTILPDIRFIAPNTTSVDTGAVKKADYVYFFTDTLSHRNYFRYMNCCKENHVAFGYLHGVNIEANIKRFYDDLIKEVN